MLTPETEARLVERMSVASDPVIRALKLPRDGIVQRVKVLDALAEDLGLSSDRFNDAGYLVLDELLGPLQAAMDLGPGYWVDDGLTNRHREIAETAIRLLTVDDLLAAAAQFGWQKYHLSGDRPPRLFEVERLVRDLFTQKLAQRVFNALEKWRKANAWPATADSLRLIHARSHSQ
jgi:hypothetical protein